MTRFLHLPPLGRKTTFLPPLTPKNEKFDPPPNFCIKISRHLQKSTPKRLVCFLFFAILFYKFYPILFRMIAIAVQL